MRHLRGGGVGAPLDSWIDKYLETDIHQLAQNDTSRSPTKGGAPWGGDPCTLRIIMVNDVYEIENLPQLATCIQQMGTGGPYQTICVLPGDFVAPSLLSSLDKGRGMI